LGNWGSHLDFDFLVVGSEDISTQNIESLVSSILMGRFDGSLSNNPRVVSSDFIVVDFLFDGVGWSIGIQCKVGAHDEN
jgi:hypothetical protein